MFRRHTDIILYIIQALIGTIIGFSLFQFYPTIGAWCLFSIILVLAPERKDSVNLALTRVKANLVGSAVGLLLFLIHPINMLMICIGIAITIVSCEILKLQAATRSAAVAVLIITMHEPGKYFWDIALERAFGVLLGCAIGVIITYIFHGINLQIKESLPKDRSGFKDRDTE